MSTSNDPLHEESQPAPYEEQAERIVKRPLSEAEARERAEIEQRIEDCRLLRFKSSVSIGRDLQRMRDRALWGPDYDDFVSYCQTRWDYSTIHVNRLIVAAQVVDNLPKEWNPRVTEERQARVLLRTRDLGQRIKILERAAEASKHQKGKLKGKLTVKALEEATEEEAILNAPPPFLDDPSLVIPPGGTSMGDAMRSVQATLARQAATRYQIEEIQEEREDAWKKEHMAAIRIKNLIDQAEEIFDTAKEEGRWKDFDEPWKKVPRLLKDLAERIAK